MSACYGWSREALNKVHIVDRIGSCGWVCEAADGDQRNQELSEHGRRAENLYFTGHILAKLLFKVANGKERCTFCKM